MESKMLSFLFNREDNVINMNQSAMVEIRYNERYGSRKAPSWKES